MQSTSHQFLGHEESIIEAARALDDWRPSTSDWDRMDSIFAESHSKIKKTARARLNALSEMVIIGAHQG